jgi:hypothetical protein
MLLFPVNQSRVMVCAQPTKGRKKPSPKVEKIPPNKDKRKFPSQSLFTVHHSEKIFDYFCSCKVFVARMIYQANDVKTSLE